MSEELKPCPFCGSKSEFMDKKEPSVDAYDVRCTNFECYLYHGADWFLSKDVVRDAWNRRETGQDDIHKP